MGFSDVGGRDVGVTRSLTMTSFPLRHTHTHTLLAFVESESMFDFVGMVSEF